MHPMIDVHPLIDGRCLGAAITAVACLSGVAILGGIAAVRVFHRPSGRRVGARSRISLSYGLAPDDRVRKRSV